MTWVDALVIGVAQAFAPLPGVSRSGLTIAAALARGLARPWAVGFSLLIAVPTILGAAGYELLKSAEKPPSTERIAQILAATALAGLVGYLAILWLVRIVNANRLWYFSVYLFLLAGLILLVLAPTHHGTNPPTPPDSTPLADPAGRPAASVPHRGDPHAPRVRLAGRLGGAVAVLPAPLDRPVVLPRPAA
jgi:undecaprenyl-diphosphatase